MTDQFSQQMPSDERLVAFLDDQLDAEERARVAVAIAENPAVAERVEWLGRSNLPFREAYDELLEQAPHSRLAEMLETLPSKPARRSMSRRGFLAVAASFMVAGIAADRLFQAWHAPKDQTEVSWRSVVADYMTLYTAQTLDGLPDDEGSQRAQLRTLDKGLGLVLEPPQVLLPGAQLKRAQMLEYESEPIAQLAYLDPRHGPLALCITRAKKGVRAPTEEVRRGMNVVFWVGQTHAYMLIGRNPASELHAMAELLRQRFAV
ncbi:MULTISPECIES: anti-sigma factor family protein [Pseudomonas]|uniref:Putative transmembrane transcriptional regulator (Anti-sigma factor) n=1 Tax=Pseudomonas asplenii TaxID=53407 RepID=A0A0M9GFY5_9PSED|nr:MULTISPECIES: transcriptional regulator [Pseudomonas]KPA90224.1 putative transmembrane transcriptional regulator (anti-sigma factor) [Pseudomonas fuscovaginae]KPA96129.1 putative transmembrane transcriptional regulator (anti-sigma factor) [Pseudomonas fuscovaginae]